MARDRTCVVGAGPAGIATAKVFLDDGYDVTVIEKQAEIGGTWTSDRRYPGLRHQMPDGVGFELVDMPDGPLPEGLKPSGEIQEYLREYADSFGVADRVRLETEVVALERRTDADGWVVETRDVSDGPEGGTETHQFDYVVVCSGGHHLPRRPEFPGLAAFDGEVYHSSEVLDETVFADRDVVVVGCGKSAVDLATESARPASSTRMVFRKANWMIPQRLWGWVHWSVLYTRAIEALFPRYYNEDAVRRLDRMPLWMKLLGERVLRHGVVTGAKYDRMPDDIVPETTLMDASHAGIMPAAFPDLVLDGEITPTEAEIERFEDAGLRLDTGEHVPADVVVLATGHRNEYPFLDDDVRLKNDDGQFYLYRGIVPPDEDGLGVIGRREVFNNFLSMNLSAHWLSAYFRDELVETPSTEEMHETIQARLDWLDELIPQHRGYDYGAYNFHTFDELLVDVGVPTRRRSNVLAEWLVPGRGRMYDGLHEERRAVRSGQPLSDPATAASGEFRSVEDALGSLVAGALESVLDRVRE